MAEVKWSWRLRRSRTGWLLYTAHVNTDEYSLWWRTSFGQNLPEFMLSISRCSLRLSHSFRLTGICPGMLYKNRREGTKMFCRHNNVFMAWTRHADLCVAQNQTVIMRLRGNCIWNVLPICPTTESKIFGRTSWSILKLGSFESRREVRGYVQQSSRRVQFWH